MEFGIAGRDNVLLLSYYAADKKVLLNLKFFKRSIEVYEVVGDVKLQRLHLLVKFVKVNDPAVGPRLGGANETDNITNV